MKFKNVLLLISAAGLLFSQAEITLTKKSKDQTEETNSRYKKTYDEGEQKAPLGERIGNWFKTAGQK